MAKIKKIHRFYFVLLMMTTLFLFLGCQKDDEGSVYEKVIETNEQLTTYETKATMKVRHVEGEEHVSLVIKKEDLNYYVNLIDSARDLDQTLIKNETGVYLLTENERPEPFRLDWPEERPQLYLIESIVSTLKENESATLEEVEEGYRFFVEQPLKEDPDLTEQYFTFDKDTYLPLQVIAQNRDSSKIVTVDFMDTVTEPKFSKALFDVAQEESDEEEHEKLKSEEVDEKKADMSQGWYYPSETFNQTLERTEEKEINGKKVVMMNYNGDQPFTFFQVGNDALPLDDELKTVVTGGKKYQIFHDGFAWSNESTTFYIVSESLTPAEKEDIVTSVQWIENK